MAGPAEGGRFRFGSFDFDLPTRELRRNGIPVRLQAQPAQVLALLLSRAGEVVTREELRTSVWDADTFVDFDRGLNFCIAQIRSALGDSATSPLYVKTLPKRGYQFIAPVGAPDAVVEPRAEPTPETPSVTRKRVGPWVLGIGTAFVLIGALLILRPWRGAPNPTRVAIARFDNLTGDREFDRFTDGLTNAVIAEFAGWGPNKFGVIGNAAVLRQARGQRDLIAMHSATGADAVVLGDVQRNAEGIQVFAQLIGLPNQVHLKVTRIRTAESDLLQAQSELAKRIVHDLSPRLEKVTPAARRLTSPAK